MKKPILVSALALSCVAFAISTARADVTLNPLFTDNMVVQRDLPIPIYGTARPGEAVRVLAGFRFARTIADARGNWEVKLPARGVGAPFQITVQGDHSITLHNVLAGDVWLAGGQSNMEFAVAGSDNAAAEIASANFPGIRYFRTDYTMADTPRTNATGGPWQIVTPQTVPGLTAVGYFFARNINQKTGVPIGILNSNWGGTSAEAWTSRAALQSSPALRDLLQRFTPANSDNKTAQDEYQKQLLAWQTANYLPFREAAPATLHWRDADFDDSDWKTLQAPGVWEETANLQIDGAVWLRRTVDVPTDWAGHDLQLHLGAIDDWDETYFNGVRVGSTGPEIEDAWTKPREYSVPGNLVKAGRNVIAVRVFDRIGGGGFSKLATPIKMELLIAGGSATPLDLSGTWRYQAEFARPQASLPPLPQPATPADSPNRSTVLFNGKIAPLTRSPIKGVLWYQGENNAGRAYQYQALLPAMIRDWRAQWRGTGSGAFPFYIVELANWQARSEKPGEDSWAELREAQQMTADHDPNSGIATAVDIGDAADIHPKNKQEVGRRLALIALAKDYGMPSLENSGPRFASLKVEGDTVRINFTHAAGLKLKSDESSFALAGDDRVFHWATARIEGSSVVLSSPNVKNPVATRYAWAINPATPLYNAADLPALPFRTDSWPGVTVNNK